MMRDNESVRKPLRVEKQQELDLSAEDAASLEAFRKMNATDLPEAHTLQRIQRQESANRTVVEAAEPADNEPILLIPANAEDPAVDLESKRELSSQTEEIELGVDAGELLLTPEHQVVELKPEQRIKPPVQLQVEAQETQPVVEPVVDYKVEPPPTNPTPQKVERWYSSLVKKGVALLDRYVKGWLPVNSTAIVDKTVEMVEKRLVPTATEPTAEVSERKYSELEQSRIFMHDINERLFAKDPEIVKAAKAELVGKTLHLDKNRRYQVIREHGQGGLSATFVVRDQAGKDLFMKILKKVDMKEVNGPSHSSETAHVRANILEMATVKRLALADTDIGPKFAAGQFTPDPRQTRKERNDIDMRIPWMVMEQVHGSAIDRFCVEHKAEPLVVIDAIKQVTAALEKLHSLGLVHSDIKPANILVEFNPSTKQVKVKLIDLGAAQVVNAADWKTDRAQRLKFGNPNVPNIRRPVYGSHDVAMFTRSYMAQGAYELPSRERDLGSLGRTIQAIIYGKDYKVLENMKARKDQLSYPQRQLSDLAEHLVQANPKERWNTSQAMEFLQRLEATEDEIEEVMEDIQAVG